MEAQTPLTPPIPVAPLEVRLARAVRFVGSLIEQAIRKRPNPVGPVTQAVPEDMERAFGPLMFQQARLVIEEWVRTEKAERDPMKCQLVATAVGGLRRTIEAAAAEVKDETNDQAEG